jgi:tetratricopeptide (TPR) repeat protein
MPSLHERAKEVFLSALSYPPADRAVYLTESCGGDTTLREEVESLLAYHEETAGGADATPSRRDRSTQIRRFAPGDLFGARYRMITRIGRGGMGEVWHAEDVVLGTSVALKLITSTDSQARERILNEVRLARQITHPAICRVFDVGEADGEVFFSMELVRGEDLASLLRRVGRLPSEKVIDIARQLCAGVASAHAQGVLHRDLKPANVLIDQDGLVRITDFGIAVATAETARHMPIGTPGYMAPEQLVPGSRLTVRTDLYALGLVLYELVAGQPPSIGAVPRVRPPKLSLLVPDADPNLERVVLHALAPDPQDRPESAAAMAAALEAAPAAGRGGKSRGWVVGSAVAALLAVGALAGSFLVKRTSAGLTSQDVIVLADFQNTTGEPVFDGALKVALAVALEQSPFLKVFPDERVQQTLRLMNRPTSERVTRAIAREIAQREQLKALLAGSIGTLGRNYVLAIEAVNAESGDVMAREQVEVPNKEQVLTALGQATARLREKLGESLASINRFDVPLARATTESLEALHAYSLALDQGRVNPRLEAIPHLQRAIELDPEFALALALLSGVYANTGQTSLAPALSRRAFELRERVSERERFFISWRYYRDAEQAWDKALELARSWTATYPREAIAFNSLGTAFIWLGQYDEAVEPFRQGLRLDPKLAPLYSNLAGALMATNRFGDAKAVLREAEGNRIEFAGIHRMAYLLAWLERDTAAMTRHFEASIGVRQTNSAYGWQAHAAAAEGRVSAAHDHFRRGVQLALQNGFKEVATQMSVEDAEAHALVGQCPVALAELDAALWIGRDNFSLERASRVYGFCGAEEETTALTTELARRYPQATLTNRVAIPVARAALAFRRGEWVRTLELLAPLEPYDSTPFTEFWPAFLRGHASLHLKQPEQARMQFQQILERRGQGPLSQLYPLAHVGLARAAALKGDASTARAAYDHFFAAWPEADAGLALVRDARQNRDALP